jgi:hypothetical protein
MTCLLLAHSRGISSSLSRFYWGFGLHAGHQRQILSHYEAWKAHSDVLRAVAFLNLAEQDNSKDPLTLSMSNSTQLCLSQQVRRSKTGPAEPLGLESLE